jgi:hypothetical protein
MANKEAMLDKIARNLKQRGLSEAAVVRTASGVSVTKTGGDVITISYVDKAIQSPMGGVSPAASPFLGIGVAAPGALRLKGAAAESTIAAIIDTVEAVQVVMELSGFANDVIIESGASTTELARVRGIAEAMGMGS